jgi:hypothetical protein
MNNFQDHQHSGACALKLAELMLLMLIEKRFLDADEVAMTLENMIASFRTAALQDVESTSGTYTELAESLRSFVAGTNLRAAAPPSFKVDRRSAAVSGFNIKP